MTALTFNGKSIEDMDADELREVIRTMHNEIEGLVKLYWFMQEKLDRHEAEMIPVAGHA